jgi:hypothetical protein
MADLDVPGDVNSITVYRNTIDFATAGMGGKEFRSVPLGGIRLG